MKKIDWKKTVLLTAILTSSVASADQVISDDSIVVGSECVGFDCADGEAFSFSTVKLKENNLRIEFTDTSSSGSFPSNDWQITINDSVNGGENYFSVDDVTGAKKLFKISPDGTIAMGIELASTFSISPSGDLAIKGTLSDSSDVNLKENIVPVKNDEVLQKISTLPISTWNYIDNKQKERHIGAMAQDFYKAFEFGPDNRHIAPKDAAFVAMAGVKELLKELEIRDRKIEELQNRVDELKALQTKFENLEAMVDILLNKGETKTLALRK